MIELCKNLIQHQSYSGQEKDVMNYIRQVFEQLGYDKVYCDDFGNVIGEIRGNYPGPNLLFDGHVDTVPVDQEKWDIDPFSGEVTQNKIYGRGASDMKGAVSAMISSASYFAKDLDKNFAGNLYVACGVHEECFEGVASRKISQLIKPDYVVIGESTNLNVNRGQRGRAEIVIETFGKRSHSSNPEKGLNAVYQMTDIIQKIKQSENKKHDVLGLGLLELTDIKSSPYPGASVVPDYCRVTYDRRLLVGETKESVLRPIQEAINQLHCAKDNIKISYALGSEVCYTGEVIKEERFFPGWIIDDNDPFVQGVINGLREIGIHSNIGHYSFCTNGSHYAGEAGIKTIGFGPSYEALAHIDNEYIEIDQLHGAMKGYYSIMKSVLQLNIKVDQS